MIRRVKDFHSNIWDYENPQFMLLLPMISDRGMVGDGRGRGHSSKGQLCRAEDLPMKDLRDPTRNLNQRLISQHDNTRRRFALETSVPDPFLILY